jgi:hypothetical protein
VDRVAAAGEEALHEPGADEAPCAGHTHRRPPPQLPRCLHCLVGLFRASGRNQRASRHGMACGSLPFKRREN